MFLSVVMFITLVGGRSRAQDANVTSFKQTPLPGHVVAGDVVTIECEATASAVYWFVNLSRNFSSEVFHVTTMYDGEVDWNTTLSTTATVDINNTRITCYASGSSSQAHRNVTYIILADRPLPPPASLEVMANGSVLHMWWNEPHSSANFPITAYNLRVYNETMDNLLLSASLNSTQLYYDYEKQEKFNIPCQKVIFAVVAVNDIGISDLALEEGVFPIFPESDGIRITYDVVFMVDRLPRLTVQFQEIIPALLACSLQVPSHYTLYILDYDGIIVASSATKLARPTHGNIFTEQFTSGIRQNNTYSIRLVFTHSQLSGQVILTKDGVVVPILQRSTIQTPTINSTPETETMVISVAAVGLIVLVVGVVLAVLISLTCIWKKRRRVIRDPTPNRDSAHAGVFQLSDPPKSRAEVTKTLAAMSVNPIYDGPTYDSPGGESFNFLIGNKSVPSTSLAGDSNRYHGMLSQPPSLPPPRKASAVCNDASLLSKMPCKDDVYTTMNPISSRDIPDSRVVPCPPDIPPLTLQESMGGDYVLCLTQVNSTRI